MNRIHAKIVFCVANVQAKIYVINGEKTSFLTKMIAIQYIGSARCCSQSFKTLFVCNTLKIMYCTVYSSFQNLVGSSRGRNWYGCYDLDGLNSNCSTTNQVLWDLQSGFSLTGWHWYITRKQSGKLVELRRSTGGCVHGYMYSIHNSKGGSICHMLLLNWEMLLYLSKTHVLMEI